MKAKKLSIVVPSYNEETNVDELLKRVQANIPDGYQSEVLFVDDGSRDGTLAALRKLAATNKSVRYISFSRNFGHQAALLAGLTQAQGDAVISMDADLQHPPEMIPELIEQWQQGYQVVYTVRRDTHKTPFLKRLTSGMFYKVINWMADLSIEEGAADFRLLDRRVVDVVCEQSENNMFLRGYINWMGFRQIGIEYTPAERFSGKSKYTLKKMMKLASDGITQFSIKPLRVGIAFAGVLILSAIIYALYATFSAMNGHLVPGWLSLVMLLVLFQGLQFLLMGLMGEYLGRVFMQTKQRPDFIIAETSEDGILNSDKTRR